MDKLVRDGKVAVLYSPGFGAGWSTWNTEHPDMVFDRQMAEAVLAGDWVAAERRAAEAWPDAYTGGLRQLKVEWLPVGTAFRIEEYDGDESVEEMGCVDWLTA